MSVILYFGFSLLVLMAGFTMIGVTFYRWRQEAKERKQQQDVIPVEPSSSSR